MFDVWPHDPSFNDLWCRAFTFAMNKGMTGPRASQFAVDYAERYEDCPVLMIPTPATFEVNMAIEDRLYHHTTKETHVHTDRDSGRVCRCIDGRHGRADTRQENGTGSGRVPLTQPSSL